MLKKLAIFLIILITLILITPMAVSAQDSYSVRISCTIPVIPGVNSPLIKDDTEENEKSNSSIIFENDEEEVQLVQGNAQIVAVKTIYSR